MIPAYMMQIDALPMNNNGKLDRRALPEIIYDKKSEYVAPVNDLQKTLCELFEEVLETKNVGIKDDFFALGGHSLKIARLVNKIDVKLGVKLPLKSVFSHTTVESLSKYMEEIKEGGSGEGLVKAEKKDFYPMSSAQKRMYLIQQMDEESIVYNMPRAMHLSLDTDPDKIKNVLQQLVDRHEILRTSFSIIDGEPVQIIHEGTQVDFTYQVDEEKSADELMQEFVKPFDLSRDSMLRVLMVKRENEYMLMMDLHHIIGDGASDAVFIGEFNELYKGGTLPEIEYQYKDYSEWMLGRDISNQKDYWIKEFADDMFINTLAIRGLPKKDKTFEEFAREIKESCLKAYENQEYPFEELVEEVNVKRDLSRNPLFDVMLVMQNTENEQLQLGEAAVTYDGQASCVSKFDLTFNFFETNGQFGLSLEYCTDLFTKDTIAWMINHLIFLVKSLISNPKASISEYDLCIPEEKEQIITKFNDTTVSYDKEKTICELFEEQVSLNPEKHAFVYEDKVLTYGMLNAYANSLAHKLRDIGVGPEDYVVVIARRRLELIQGIYGVIKSGAAYVPVDPDYPIDRIMYMIEDCCPKAILTYGFTLDTDIPVFDLEDQEVWNGNTENPVCLTKPENLLYLIYTSGTTGKPKGVMLQNSSVMNYCAKNQHSIMSDAYDMGYTRIASVTNLTFDIFVTELILPMVNGLTTYLTNEDEQHISKAFFDFVDRNDIEIIQTKLIENISREELERKCKKHLIVQSNNMSGLLGACKNFNLQDVSLVDDDLHIYDNVESVEEFSKFLYESGVVPTKLILESEKLEDYYLKKVGVVNE